MSHPRLDRARAKTALSSAALILLGVAIADESVPIEQRAALVVMSIGLLLYLARNER